MAAPAPSTATPTTPAKTKKKKSTASSLKYGDRIECPAGLQQLVHDRLELAIKAAGQAVANIQSVIDAPDQAAAQMEWQSRGFEDWFGPYSRVAARRLARRLAITAGTLVDPDIKIVCSMDSRECKTKDASGNPSQLFGEGDPGERVIRLCGSWFDENNPLATFTLPSQVQTSDWEQINTIDHEGSHLWSGAPDSRVKGKKMYGEPSARWLGRNHQKKAVRNADNIAYYTASTALPDPTAATAMTPATGQPDYLGCEQSVWYKLNMDSKTMHDVKLQVAESLRQARERLQGLEHLPQADQLQWWALHNASGLADERPARLRRLLRRSLHTLENAEITCTGGSSQPAVSFAKRDRWLQLSSNFSGSLTDQMRTMAQTAIAVHESDTSTATDLAKVVVP